MNITKQQDAAEQTAAQGAPADGDLELINTYARTPLTGGQVYAFAVRLCDNEVDRDCERFDEESLNALGGLFVGKTGIFDHQWSAAGQTARIYKTELIREPEKKTAAGDGYCWLKGWAYLLRSEKNAELIGEIEGGIKKEVSVGCAVQESICSICGARAGTCEHVKGQRYGGKLCYAELRRPTDAYEWSFVAVPAQSAAGVVKKFTGGKSGDDDRELQYQAQLGRNYLSRLKREVVRLSMLCDADMDGALLAKAVDALNEQDLLGMEENYRKRVARLFPAPPQLRPAESAQPRSGSSDAFLI